MKSSRRKMVSGLFGAVIALVAIIVLVYLLGCGGGGEGRGVMSGYAYLDTRGVVRATAVISSCSASPPQGYVPAVGYLVYLDDTAGPPDATVGSNGYWSVETTAGQHTIHICPPSGPPPVLSFDVTALSGQERCEPSHEQGGS